MTEVYPIDSYKEEIIMVYSSDLKDLVEQVYDGVIKIEYLFYNIKNEIYSKHDVQSVGAMKWEMDNIDSILDDLCSLGHLEKATYLIRYE